MLAGLNDLSSCGVTSRIRMLSKAASLPVPDPFAFRIRIPRVEPLKSREPLDVYVPTFTSLAGKDPYAGTATVCVEVHALRTPPTLAATPAWLRNENWYCGGETAQ